MTACNSNNDSGDFSDGSGGSSDDSGGSNDDSCGSNDDSGGENTPFVDATFDGIEFIAIKHGSFTMGSNDGPEDEQPAHEVCISRDFYLSKTEVTQKQWKAAGMIPLKNQGLPSFYDDDKPAISHMIFLGVDTITVFAEFTKKLGEKTGGHYRLPTEAEWEYAARAGTTTKYFFGDSTGSNDEVLKEYAWFGGNSGGTIHKVALKEPNPWGLYDIYGNVYELTQDYYHKDYYKQRVKDDPVNRDQVYDNSVFLRRVLRGGIYSHEAKYLSSTARHCTAVSGYIFGFRLVRER
jgi:formylglycine-generating enzyme required for sulfatase activity